MLLIPVKIGDNYGGFEDDGDGDDTDAANYIV